MLSDTILAMSRLWVLRAVNCKMAANTTVAALLQRLQARMWKMPPVAIATDHDEL